ncbi:hypothetical protein [Paenibacillus polysaccharolyticus]|uniref:hypothetical protein n=1 Tax=Paenibacillus polysaccharolyticus TaxID=582692 RepID=UPI00280B0490|nr:hypothetical protein [Paenibacillus polysaccharolyticus]
MRRVEFKLKQNEDEFLKSWRVIDFANKINELHYKHELLNEVRNRIKGGDKPQNFFVFDKSFSIHRSYRYLGIHKLSSKNGVKNLYHLGIPIPLYSNPKIDAVRYIFDSFSRMYTEFNKETGEGKVKLDKSNLYFFVKEAMSSEKIIEIHKYQKYLNTYISTVIEPKSQNKMRDLVSEELRQLRIRYNDRYEIQKKMIEIEEEIKSNKTESLYKNYKELVSKVPGAFERSFINNKRPIVGVYNEENNSVEILCKNFIKQKAKEDRQFDLKNISHNSPYVIVFLATYVLAQLFYQMYVNKIDKLQVQNEIVLDDIELVYEGYEEREQSHAEAEETQNKTLILEENRNRLEEVAVTLESREQQNELPGIPPSVENTLTNISNSNISKMAINFDQNGFSNGSLYLSKTDEENNN